MANEFITVKEIARQILPRLIENLVFPNLIHKDFSDEYVNGKGATIQVKKPVVLTAKDFNESEGISTQDVKEESVDVTLDKLATVDVEFGAIQRATNVDDLNRLFLEPAAVALAEKINSDGLFLYKDIPYAVGTAGTTPSKLTDLANVRKMLNTNKVPVAGRVAVWDPEADANFTTIDAIVNAEKSGSTAALREGSIGRVFGLDNYMAQGVKQHATGITKATDVKVNGKVTAGATSLAIDGTALTGKLVKGDILTIKKNNYVVVEDTADASINAIASVKVYPALPEIADDTVVTLISGHTANLAFNPMAFAFVTRPLIAPAGVESYVTSYNGITLRVVRGYDMKYKKEMLSMDVLYGYKTMYPELATRVLG
ncbi:MAG: P22 phage major capsid protein family protein [Clostridium septicum]|uniref:P22 phage major capsid protein family protein n=1 Tax=Clostridium septicum TaxID=1504 RepID=UPI00258B1223|nr:P22 phage major capsid protein family protein [Clostridium septicum]MDU1314473.1 P22 phage major capsid protein family protein [Clostridium septicum]